MQMDEHNRFSEALRVETDMPSASMADFSEADYLPYLEGLDVTTEQASELLRILWDICRMSIEMDLPPENWGQITPSIFTAAASDSGVVK